MLVVFLASLILFCGCAQVTNIRTQMDSNPLKNIAQGAANDYSVTWVNDNTLEITDFWPTHSIFSLGYTAFHANLTYSGNELEGDYYLQSNQLGLLFIPVLLDAGPGSGGLLLKPYMKTEINEILGFAGTSMESSAVRHSQPKKVIK